MMEMVKKLALLGFSLCVMLLSGELLVRYLVPAWPFEPALYIPEYLSARPPAAMEIFRRRRTEQSGAPQSGSGPKPPGTTRILFLGDSVIWGSDTSAGALYTEVLERCLNARALNGSAAFEVINVGVPGWTVP